MRGKLGPRFTPEDAQTIRAMIVEGKNSGEVAKALNRPRNSILGFVDRRKLGPWMPRDQRALLFANTIPDDFKAVWLTKNQADLALHYGCSSRKISRWVNTLGLVRKADTSKANAARKSADARKPRLVSTRVHGHKPTPIEIYRDQSPAGLAADILRRDRWIVYRCNEDRRQSQGGKFWMCGRVLCTDAELIERAERAARKLAA